jgi:hypothetical protein
VAGQIPLSPGTRRAVRAVFCNEHWERVERTLLADCGPPKVETTLDGLDRIRLAVLKTSAGDLRRFDEAVLLAQIDWRDVLMGAGFGDDLSAHLRWQPRGPE